jgi:hypothetical protein
LGVFFGFGFCVFLCGFLCFNGFPFAVLKKLYPLQLYCKIPLMVAVKAETRQGFLLGLGRVLSTSSSTSYGPLPGSASANPLRVRLSYSGQHAALR